MFDSSLSKKIKLWGFEQGLMVFSDGAVGSALELCLIDVNLSDDHTLNSLKSTCRSFLNGLPSGLKIQFVQEITSGNDEVISLHRKNISNDCHPLIAEMTALRAEEYTKADECGELPVQKIYLLIKKDFSAQSRKGNLFGLFKKAQLTERILMDEINIFQRVLDAMKTELSSFGLKPTSIPEEKMFRLIYNQWNPDRPIDGKLGSSVDVRDQIAMTDLVVGPDYLKIGRMYHKVLTLKILPEVSFATMSAALARLPFDSKLYLTFETLDQNKEQSKLQTQRRLAYASVVGKRGAQDLEAKAKLEDIEALLESIIQSSEKVFSFAVQVVLKSTDLGSLDNQVSDTLQLFRELSGAEAMVETAAALDVFCEVALPQITVKERAIKVTTSILADFLPLYGNFQGSESPRVLLRNASGGLFSFDPFSKDLSNANQIISGGSGAGKSFCMNLMSAQVLRGKTKIFILDIGGSYKRFCEQVDGQYLDLGVNSKVSINPLSVSGLSCDDSEALDQKIKFIGSLVEVMTKEKDSKGLGRLVRSEIERITQDLLKNNSDVKLSDLQSRLLVEPSLELNTIGKILSLWCGDSPYAKVVDRDTNVSLEKNVVCFDLKSLEGHPELQSVMLFLITDLIWREIQKDRTTEKFLIFDECWRLLDNEQGAEFIGPVFRTVRKYKTSAIGISQTMDDFSKSKVASAIMPNAATKWLLKQDGANFENLKTALQLNDREIKAVTQLKSVKGEYSESLLMAGDRHSLVRIEATPLEYWISTTHPQDMTLLKTEQEKNPAFSNIELIHHLAKKFPKGA